LPGREIELTTPVPNRATPGEVIDADWLRPEGLPSQVGAVMTTRRGGASRPPWDSLNLGGGVGDLTDAVARNRLSFAQAIVATPVFLKQVHGASVVRLAMQDAQPSAAPHEADASVTTEPGLACSVLVADCLPLLFAAPEGRAVAAAHAGWRGLAAGVVEATLRRLCEVAACDPADVQVWLGACIGPRQFEVGADVLQAFGADPARPDALRFAARTDGSAGKWLANLPLLAQDRLSRAGVAAFSGGAGCTVEERSRFFSYRRDGVTGRMAAVIWIRR
jgi:YfiH family protein